MHHCWKKIRSNDPLRPREIFQLFGIFHGVLMDHWAKSWALFILSQLYFQLFMSLLYPTFTLKCFLVKHLDSVTSVIHNHYGTAYENYEKDLLHSQALLFINIIENNNLLYAFFFPFIYKILQDKAVWQSHAEELWHCFENTDCSYRFLWILKVYITWKPFVGIFSCLDAIFIDKLRGMIFCIKVLWRFWGGGQCTVNCVWFYL